MVDRVGRARAGPAAAALADPLRQKRAAQVRHGRAGGQVLKRPPACRGLALEFPRALVALEWAGRNEGRHLARPAQICVCSRFPPEHRAAACARNGARFQATSGQVLSAVLVEVAVPPLAAVRLDAPVPARETQRAAVEADSSRRNATAQLETAGAAGPRLPSAVAHRAAADLALTCRTGAVSPARTPGRAGVGARNLELCARELLATRKARLHVVGACTSGLPGRGNLRHVEPASIRFGDSPSGGETPGGPFHDRTVWGRQPR